MKPEVTTSVKWVSKFNHGDRVRHKCDEGEKGMITSVKFSMNSKNPTYLISNGASDRWWYEDEIIRVIGGAR